MEWFSLWFPVILQLIVPVSLLVWLALERPTSNERSIALAILVATYVLAIGIAGLWLVLPWWLPFAYGALLVGIVARSLRRRHSRPLASAAVGGRAFTVFVAAVAVVLIGIVGMALAGRRLPGEPIDLEFPLRSGTYLVLNGGSQVLINAHISTIDDERFEAYQGQSYGVDLVRINSVGLRAHGVLPRDPSAYFIFGDPVFSPCRGRVLSAQDGAEDMAPPQTDRVHMVGNNVILECGLLWVVLGHLQRGSVAIQAGEVVEVGQVIGRVGNSGNTGEPHLHMHAQTPGLPSAPLNGEPVPMRLGNRYLVRNDRIDAARSGS